MVEEEQHPANEKTPKELEELLTSDEEIDDAKAALILDRSGIDREASHKRLKVKLEKKVQEMENEGREVPPTLLKILGSL
jgi:hypothetical protein